jgi:hypothetical protein
MRRNGACRLHRQAFPGHRNQQGIDGLEDIVLEAVRLKHDAHLRR